MELKPPIVSLSSPYIEPLLSRIKTNSVMLFVIINPLSKINVITILCCNHIVSFLFIQSVTLEATYYRVVKSYSKSIMLTFVILYILFLIQYSIMTSNIMDFDRV